MGKVGFIKLDQNLSQHEINFKKLFLMFDKILVMMPDYRLFNEIKRYTSGESFEIIVDKQKLNNSPHIKDWFDLNYLEEKGTLKFIRNNLIVNESRLENSTLDDWPEIKTHLSKNYSQMGSHFRVPFHQNPELALRLLTVAWKEYEGHDIFPIIPGFPRTASYAKTKTDVLRFLLSDFPTPADNVSWDQLSDFKSDPDTMRKYYALIKWVNDVSKKNLPLNEIKDEYNSLFHDYAYQYRIHKMKHKQTVLEIIVTAAIDVLCGTLGASKVTTSLFNIWKNNINLLEAETKFIGKEVAYIHKAKDTFD